MHYLYGIAGSEQKLVATFDSEEQLLAYLRWATQSRITGRLSGFEQASALTGFSDAIHVVKPHIADDVSKVVHNPSPYQHFITIE